MDRMISSSSAFRFCALFVAPVRGCWVGGVFGRGAGREKGVEAGASNMEKGSVGSVCKN